jgi:UDP-GlcNAc:undecaprenyl-phosphate GlcNAc-1-phosphate transferase
MTFPFNLYTAAFLSAFVFSIGLFPVWKKWCEKIGHVDDPGHRKIHAAPVPLAGGLTVVSGFFIPLLIASVTLVFSLPIPGNPVNVTIWDILQHGLSRRAIQLLSILIGALAMLLLGWLDDRYELSPKIKFSGQLLIAILVVSSGIRITLFIPIPFINWTVTILWILSVTNAFNFMDNMNGLCAGLGIIASWYCAWAAAIHGQYLVAILGFLICGALLGFFPFNFPSASAFLGDAGSHLVGFLAAVLSILPDFYSAQTPHPFAVTTPLLILSVLLIDLISVIAIRLSTGKPIYIGDNNHLSHLLVRKGVSKSTAVLILLLANAVVGALPFLLFY